MTLTSVLYCLAADHLRTDTFQEFAERVEPIQGRLPILSFDARKASVAKVPAHFKSSHWFAIRARRRVGVGSETYWVKTKQDQLPPPVTTPDGGTYTYRMSKRPVTGKVTRRGRISTNYFGHLAGSVSLFLHGRHLWY